MNLSITSRTRSQMRPKVSSPSRAVEAASATPCALLLVLAAAAAASDSSDTRAARTSRARERVEMASWMVRSESAWRLLAS